MTLTWAQRVHLELLKYYSGTRTSFDMNLTTLRSLERKGLIRSETREPTNPDLPRTALAWFITDDGRKALTPPPQSPSPEQD